MNRADARGIIAELREDNGGISAEDRRNTPQRVLRSFDNRGRQLGKQLLGLVDDLYSKDSRFAFELIQNAEDNQYKKAADDGEEPFIKFTLYPDSIVVDSNEDGFQRNHVEAICNARESTKTSSEGYIGEKGIGFKSLFRVATKVHIQSEPFSFYFEHNRGDDGMGLITPLDGQYHSLPINVRTRITLTLSPTYDSDELIKDFAKPLQTVLLFLTKIKNIDITRVQSDGLIVVEKLWYEFNSVTQRGILNRSVSRNDGADTISSSNYYHITRRIVSDLPNDAHRTWEANDQVMHSNKAEVVLAFPLDHHAPLIKNQEVFAFLPMKDYGFKFLIQSDFITTSNRQDIVENKWNAALLDGITFTFRDAVVQLCNHPGIKYQWMRYLPGNHIQDGFWSLLLPKVVRLLKETPILISWTGKTLKLPHQTRYLGNDALDEQGNPLFEDLHDELYLAKNYESTDRLTLSQLGLNVIQPDDLLARIRADLDKPSSVLKSSQTSENWHSRTAKLLLKFTRINQRVAEQVYYLNLLPLRDGSWISADAIPFYNPLNGNIPVPTDLGLQLLDIEALRNLDREALFLALGAKDCLPADIIAKITRKYTIQVTDVSLQNSIMHLQYLYWNLPQGTMTLDDRIFIKDHNERPVYRVEIADNREQIVDDVYFDSQEQYGPRNLCSKVLIQGESIAPAYPAHFLHPTYLDVVPARARRFDLSWSDWLGTIAKVRRVLRLTDISGTKVADVFRHVIEHRKDKLLEVLRRHWHFYNQPVPVKKEITDALSKARVPCDNCTDTTLQRAYLPMPQLKRICEDFGVGGKLPYVTLPDVISDEAPEWSFLKSLKVGCKPNLNFHLDILRETVRLLKGLNSPLNNDSTKNLFRLYEIINQKSKADAHNQIRQVFTEEQAIYVPAQGVRSPAWRAPDECVWNAPIFYDLHSALAATVGYLGSDGLKHLFSSILEIPNTGFNHYIMQLKSQKGKSNSTAVITDIYSHILAEALKEAEWKCVKENFETDNLVYLDTQGGWYPPSSCLWTDNARISGKFAISKLYPDLQPLFVGRLGVQKPDIRMYIDELMRLSDEEQPSISQIKVLIKDINSWGPKKGSLTDLSSCDILPIKSMNGDVSLEDTASVFAIVDRLEYGQVFQAKIPALDFDLEEVHELRPFISVLGLEDRFMSRAIRESSNAMNSSLDKKLSRTMQEKAHALFRCAVHYGGIAARDHLLYHRLLAAEVHRSSGITKSLTIPICDTQTTVEGARGNLHVACDDDKFRLYVPVNDRDREFCYLDHIPRILMSQLGIKDSSAIKALGAIVNATWSDVVDRILQEHGIVRVPGVEPMPPADSSTIIESVERPDIAISSPTMEHAYDAQAPTATRASSVSSSSRISSANSRSRTSSNHSRSSSNTPTTTPNTRSIDTPRSSLSPSLISPGLNSERDMPSLLSRMRVSTSPPASPTRVRRESSARSRTSISPAQDSRRRRSSARQENGLREYRDLLEAVITSAARAEFPANGDAIYLALSDVNTIPLSDAVFGRRSENQMSHDIKIGAAGELYVYEMLLKQNLPGFGRANWASTVRKEVCVHERYRDMEPWRGAETADIVYEEGREGGGVEDYMLSTLLYEKGYLPDHALRKDARIKYYLEVKTTTQSCNTRFFMSRAQYNRMHNVSLDRTTEVYIILRVFNLGQANLGMRLYVDPRSMEALGELKFEPASYIVTPSSLPIADEEEVEDIEL